MGTTGKVFLACALGAFIGSALSVWYGWWLWLGMVAGGLVGYISYNFTEVRKAAPVVLRQAATAVGNPQLWVTFGEGVQNVVFFFVRPVVRFATFWLGVLGAVAGGMVILLAAFSSLTELGLSQWRYMFIVAGATELISSIKYLNAREEYYTRGRVEFVIRRQFHKMLLFNPLTCAVVIPALALYRIPAAVQWCGGEGRYRATNTLKVIRDATLAIILFSKYLFKLIHSDLRLLCGLDAALGTGVGWYLGNPLIGALVGGVLGVINYELVSVLWLKLVPKRI